MSTVTAIKSCATCAFNHVGCTAEAIPIGEDKAACLSSEAR